MSAIRVMIAEKDPEQMQALCTALDRQDSMDIISTVSSRETVIKHLVASPDIMLLSPNVLKNQPLSRFMHSIQTKSPRMWKRRQSE